jgi:hypothetical protein
VTDVYAKVTAVSAEDAAKVVPRAEFRVFGHGIIGTVQKKMWDAGAVLQRARKMPAETYFLSAHNDEANVKVREGLLDIKTKVGETPAGYEIFQLRGKFKFPVKKADITTILSYLEVKMDLDRESWSLEKFTEMARRHSDLVPVTIEKMRYGFTVDGVICEYAQVWFNGALLESACCESDNYKSMRNAIKALGIEAMPNTNYLKAAKRVVGMA